MTINQQNLMKNTTYAFRQHTTMNQHTSTSCNWMKHVIINRHIETSTHPTQSRHPLQGKGQHQQPDTSNRRTITRNLYGVQNQSH